MTVLSKLERNSRDFRLHGKAELRDNPANEAELGARLIPNKSGNESGNRRKGDGQDFKDNEGHDD